jgi:hypothetical protein
MKITCFSWVYVWSLAPEARRGDSRYLSHLARQQG